MIINIVGTGKAHFGRNIFAHGQITVGIDDAYITAREVSRFTKFYVLAATIANAPINRFRFWRETYARRKALAVTDADLGLHKQRIVDITGLQIANPDYNFNSAESLALFEAVKSGATRVILYRVSLTDDNADLIGGLLHNVAWAERKGVDIVWAWRKVAAHHLSPLEPVVVEQTAEDKPKKTRKPRKTKEVQI